MQHQYLDMISNINSFRVSIIAYCLMPTHFHFLLRQEQEHGISMFISQIQNSFTRYFNIKNERKGPLFLHKFKSVHIASEEQFTHVSRYLHLNPYSSKIVPTNNELASYPWSSFHEYINDEPPKLCNTSFILSHFQNNKVKYRNFVLNNAEHQKTLEYCKYTTKW